MTASLTTWLTPGYGGNSCGWLPNWPMTIFLCESSPYCLARISENSFRKQSGSWKTLYLIYSNCKASIDIHWIVWKDSSAFVYGKLLFNVSRYSSFLKCFLKFLCFWICLAFKGCCQTPVLGLGLDFNFANNNNNNNNKNKNNKNPHLNFFEGMVLS